jgi:hypothetical protein
MRMALSNVCYRGKSGHGLALGRCGGVASVTIANSEQRNTCPVLLSGIKAN